MNTAIPTTVWILDKDQILTNIKTGLPITFAIQPPNINPTDIAKLEPNELIALNLENFEHANQHESKNLPTHVMRKQTALFLGLIDGSQDKNFISLRALLSQLPTADINHIIKAIQFIRWADEHNFCSRCGHRTNLHTKGENATICPACNYHQYPRIQPCVITAVTRTNPNNGKPQVLLAHHKRYAKAKKTNNQQPRYGLIAGFVEAGETLENAVHRETLEEVSLGVSNIRYFSSQPWAYPSNLMIGFIAQYTTGNADNIKVQDDELIHAQFFDLDNLPLIPPVGTIAYRLIEHLTNEHGLPSPATFWPLN